MGKGYFAILGVSAGASQEEIRSAYRRLAKVFHPDHYEGSSRPFRQIREAYSVLGDPGRRSAYLDTLSVQRRPAEKAPPVRPEPLVPEDEPVDLGAVSPLRSFHTFSPSRDELFDWLWDNFSDIAPPKSGRIQEVTIEIPLTREQARRGGIAKVMLPIRSICPDCMGYGGIGAFECYRCGGEGAIVGELPVSLSFPPGLAVDHAVVISLEPYGIRNLHATVLFRPRDVDRL